ncbi:MAG: SPFH domain-containing protein, partial [Planctomycetota bacterium]
MAPQFDPQRFLSHTDSVALHVPASEIFGLLTRSLNLPAKWAALVTRKTGDHAVVAEGGTVESADADEVMFARVSPIDLAIEEADIITRDRFSCRANVRLRVCLIPERGELLSFVQRVLGSHRVVQDSGIVRHLQPAVRTGLAKFAGEHDAAALVDAGRREALSAALGEAVKASCFEAGLRLEGAPTVEVDSRTLRQVQQAQQETARQRAEHEAARQLRAALRQAQTEHVDHLAALLTRLADLAEASPEVELPELIRTFTEQQRGELYGALFALDTPGEQTRWIVVAAGDELMFFDTGRLDSPDRRLKIAGPVGAVRSIQCAWSAVRATVTQGGPQGGPHALLLGATTGVYRLPIDRSEPDLTLEVPGPPEVRGGFNAAAGVGDRVFASHSELGLCEWDVSEPNAVRYRFESMTRQAKAVRHVQFFNGDLLCSIDDRIIRWPADEATDKPTHVYTGISATITALCVTAKGVFAGNSDGDVLHWPTGRDSDPERLHMGSRRAAESLWLLATNGVRRLVFADTSPRVRAQVLGDNFACEYEAGGQTLRRVEVAPDLIVATNDLRDRLICWTPGKPDRPTTTIGVSSLCGRSIQDVCL